MDSLDADGLIFDFDGTLADTMPIHYQAWRETLAEHGIDYPRDVFYSLGGTPTVKIVAILSERYNTPMDPAEVASRKEQAYLRRAEHIGLIEPVVAIARAHRGTLPLAVATGSRRAIIEHALDKIGLADWFDAVVTADDVTGHKPEPDTFLEAARRIGVEPKRCIAYEDTDLGLEAVRRAGMTAIDVRSLR